ncbi:7c172b3c-d1a9-40c1-a7ad-d8dcf3077b91 [Sclerotinia trifoliorum]|uniref:7c172b3c-d1a9-40c1-a7ad-d8dcf3077b91 n=1 Tax=Sclerotinia trifoliorum TaxID=28548 RepID=A0A8H2ZLT4_9HELO|nr:7c172b3c-d1a9-40c1-a7ad-d8dcf3077b91 [Sclerotinia trifoliorum]
MSEGRKRPFNDDSAIEAVSEENPGHTSKKLRKETNASARRSLFVRSLPATATTSALTELFSDNYPLKHATVVLDPVTKQSKGYGFVTFADAEDAQRALDEFNGQSFQGRKMKIEIAQPRSRETPAKGGEEGLPVKKKTAIAAEAAAVKKARQEKLAESKAPPKLIIRNLPWSVKTPDELAKLFMGFGKVKYATLPKVKGKEAGFGFIVMRGKKNAEKALAAINGREIDGRQLAVDWAVEKDVWEKKKTEDADMSDAETPKDEPEEPKDKADDDDVDDDVANFMKNFGDQLESEDESDPEAVEDNEDDIDDEYDEDDGNEEVDDFEDIDDDEDVEEEKPKKNFITDNSSTLFIRNLPFTTLDATLKEHFEQFGPVRYARVVMDKATDRPKGTGFVCFYNVEDADSCFRNCPKYQPTGANATKKGDTPQIKHSLLEPENADSTGAYTIDGRLLQISKAVEKDQAVKLTEEGSHFRDNRDKDKRKLYLLQEGTVAKGTPLYDLLPPSEVKMREDSAMQRKKLIQGNPTLHLSLTRLAIRNIPRNIDSKALKALAREAAVGFATDVKAGKRQQLSKEELARGGEEMREAEKQRKAKGKGIVRQAKVVFEGREGKKVSEESGAGKSRGYGFVEYSSHRWALMGLRWLNGHALKNSQGKTQRMIVEFAIENAQVVSRRKEQEEKARNRSKEVSDKIAKGEIVSSKKLAGRDQDMKSMRKGGKGIKGAGKNGKRFEKEKSFDRVALRTTNKRKADDDLPSQKDSKKPRNPSTNGANATEGNDDDGKQRRKAQIIQKKRMMRRNRKGGA